MNVMLLDPGTYKTGWAYVTMHHPEHQFTGDIFINEYGHDDNEDMYRRMALSAESVDMVIGELASFNVTNEARILTVFNYGRMVMDYDYRSYNSAHARRVAIRAHATKNGHTKSIKDPQITAYFKDQIDNPLLSGKIAKAGSHTRDALVLGVAFWKEKYETDIEPVIDGEVR